MYIKTTLRFPVIPVSMEFISNMYNNKCCQDLGMKKHENTVGGNKT
jgi:hypothetical protein